MTKEIPFIESLPSHWDVIPNRYLFYPDGKRSEAKVLIISFFH